MNNISDIGKYTQVSVRLEFLSLRFTENITCKYSRRALEYFDILI